MKTKTNSKISKKVLGIAGAGLLAIGAIAGGVGYFVGDDSKAITDLNAKITALEANNTAKDVTINGLNSDLTDLKEGKSGSDKTLNLVLQSIYDNEGDLDSLNVTQLDDDEVSMIADRIVFVDEIKTLSLTAVKDELADELESVDVVYKKSTGNANVTADFNDKDVSNIRLDDDFENILVSPGVDFDYKDANVVVTGTFKHEEDDDKVTYNFRAIVEIRDNEVDQVKVDRVWK
jgi:hypothetical protein